MTKHLVSEYMNKNVVVIPLNSKIRDAFELMIKRGTNGLVVVDERGGVAGILSSRDLISYVIPDYLENDKHLASFESADVFEERLKTVADELISVCMTKKVYTIHPERSLMEAATLLAEYKVRQLPVVDNDMKLVGYINRTDIKRAIGEMLGIKK